MVVKFSEIYQEKMKLEKVRGSVSGGASSSGQANTSTRQHSSQEFDQKKVTVQVGEKYKGTGQSSKKRIPSANLDIPRAFLSCREEGKMRLDLSKSNISLLPPSLKDLTHLTELYLYSNRLATLPPEIGCLVNLVTLSLSENVITSLPEQLASLQVFRRKIFSRTVLLTIYVPTKNL